MSPASRRSVGILAALALAVPLATIAAPTPAAAAPPQDVPCGQVELAPVLKGDRGDDGKKIALQPDRRGVYVPIIMVPDWHGRAKHDESRTGSFSGLIDMGAGGPAPAAPRASVIGQLQQIPGAAVYTFDYRNSAGRWVDDPGIGPALGDAIDCLTTELGQDAILLTHGTGGVAARYAVGGAVEGRDRASQVTTVIGYGSPQTGTMLAELLNTGVGSTASEPRMALRLLLGACSALKPAAFDPQAPCGFLPAQAAALSLPGSEAFRGNSPQQTALRAFPSEVDVHAFAGDVTVRAPNVGWFGLRPFRSETINLGDLISSTESTTIGSQFQLRASCTFALDAFGTQAQSLGLRLASVGGVGAVPAWSSTARPCFNPSLPRVTQFADKTRELITAEIRDRQPLDLRELEMLEVPTACGFPAGKLVGGRLPNIPAGQGEVGLASTLFPGGFDDFTTFGDLTGDGVADTVAVIKCSTAQGPGADIVAAYDSGARLLGSINLADVSDRARNEVYRVDIDAGSAIMQWLTTRETDAECCPTVDASASFTYSSGGGLEAGFLRTFTETEPVARLVDAAREGRRGQGPRKFAPVAIIEEMIDAVERFGFGDVSCRGPYPADQEWPGGAVAEYGPVWPPADGFRHGDRYCLIAIGEEGGEFALLAMEHTGFETWQGVEFLMPDGLVEVEPEDPGTFPFPGFPGEGDPTEDGEDPDEDDDGGITIPGL